MGQFRVIQMRFGISSGFSSLQTAGFLPENIREPDFARAGDRAGYANYRNSIKTALAGDSVPSGGWIRRLETSLTHSAPKPRCGGRTVTLEAK